MSYITKNGRINTFRQTQVMVEHTTLSIASEVRYVEKKGFGSREDERGDNV